MASQQFVKQLLSGFQTGYRQSAQSTFDRLADERDFQQAQEAARLERQLEEQQELEAAQEFETQNTIISGLLDPNLTPEARVRETLKLSEEGLKRFGNLRKQLDPKKEYRNVGGNLYEIVDGVLQPEPLIEKPKEPETPKYMRSQFGTHRDTGQYGLSVFKSDGSTEFIPSPLKEGSTPGAKGKVESIFDYDPIKFNRTLNPFTNQSSKIGDLKTKYRGIRFDRTGQKPTLRNQINTIAFNNEQALYSIMPEDTKQHVNNYYQVMRDNAKENNITLKEMVTFNQEDLKQDFVNDLIEKKKNKEITNEQLRVLSLWAKFKFGYLIESMEDAKRNQK